jgi:hypothetical protein
MRPCFKVSNQLIKNTSAGDIAATSGGERVGSTNIACLFQNTAFDPFIAHATASPGVLHISVPLCCLAFWDHHCSSQRNCCGFDYQKKRSGQNLGSVSCLEPKVLMIQTLFQPFNIASPSLLLIRFLIPDNDCF